MKSHEAKQRDFLAMCMMSNGREPEALETAFRTLGYTGKPSDTSDMLDKLYRAVDHAMIQLENENAVILAEVGKIRDDEVAVH